MTYGPTLLASASRVEGLSLALYTDTQTATAYLRGRPFATVQRASWGARGKVWRAYWLDGRQMCDSFTPARIVAKVEAMAKAEADSPPACVVTLAPDYELRELRLAMYRTPKGAWALCGQAPGHRFERLTYLGGEAPTFRTRADLAEWCALVGLRVAIPNGRKRGAERFAPGELEAASPVATRHA